MLKDNKSIFLALIPEIYYDLIARVTPGAIFILGFLSLKYKYLFKIEILNLEKINIGAATCILVLFLIISYFFGMFFYTLSHYPFKLKCLKVQDYAWKNVKNNEELKDLIANCLNISDKQKELLEEKPQEFERYMLDYIKDVNPDTGSIIAKMRAEAFLFSNCFVGFIILFLVTLLHPIQEWGLEKIITTVILFILIALAYFAYLHRLKSYVHRSCVFIHIFSIGEQKESKINM